jgi:opacity protein-like surface antigen
MRNKAIFLATTAVALVLMSSPANAEGLYVSVFGGPNFQQDSSGVNFGTFSGDDATTSYAESADTGFVLGAAVGARLDRWANGLRSELEVSYRRNDVSGEWYNYTDAGEDSATGTIGANTSTFAIMANLWYDFDVAWKAKPYVGAGVGWARSSLDVGVAVTDESFCCGYNGSETFSDEQSGFAWMLGAGVNYEVSPGVDVGIGYRFFRGPGFDPLFLGKNNQTAVDFDNDSQSVSANLTIHIN